MIVSLDLFGPKPQKGAIPETMTMFHIFYVVEKGLAFRMLHCTRSFPAALSLKEGRLNLAANDKLLSYKT